MSPLPPRASSENAPEVESLAELNERLVAIDLAEDARHVHGRPTSIGFDREAERGFLGPLPADGYDCGIDLTPVMQRNGRITVYGDDGPDTGPRPGVRYRELVGGPLDGQWIDVTPLSDADIADGFALIADTGGTYAGGRSLYDPPAPDDGRLHWTGDVP